MYFTNPHATLTQNSVQLFGDMNTFATNASLTAGPTFSLEAAVLPRYLCSVVSSGWYHEAHLGNSAPLKPHLGGTLQFNPEPQLAPEVLPFFSDGR